MSVQGVNINAVHAAGLSATTQVKIGGKAVVYFRTHSKYEGEYGFDWIRVEDTGKPGDVFYKNIIGKMVTKNGKDVFEQRDVEYEKLKNKFETPLNPVSSGIYVVPVLNIYPFPRNEANAVFTLRIKVEEDVKKITFKHNKNILRLNKHKITEAKYKKKGEHILKDYLIVKFKKDKVIEKDEYIEVLADGKFAGKLKVLPNDKIHRRKVKIVIVKVWTNFKGKGRPNKPTLSGRTKELKKYLQKQALVKPVFEHAVVDVSKKDSAFNKKFVDKGKIKSRVQESLQKHLNKILYDKYDAKNKDYRDFYKLYFINEKAISSSGTGNLYGAAYDIPTKSNPLESKSVAIYSPGFKDSTLAHETFHAMGLYHSFDNDGEFTFQQDETDNIMDYSDVGKHKIPVISTWQWQWPIIQHYAENE